MDTIKQRKRKQDAPTPEVPLPRPWEPGAKPPVADSRTNGGTSCRPENRSVLGNTALGEASLGNALPSAETGDPVLTGPLVADPFATGDR